MTELPAIHFDGRTSAGQPVRVGLRTCGPGTPARLVVTSATAEREFPAANCRFDMAVGTGMRQVELPGGASLQISDALAWDALLASHGLARQDRAIHRLERAWPPAVVALVVTVVLSWAVIQYGVPAVATRAVALVPPDVDASLGEGGLALLDEQVLAPTALPATRQDELRESIAGVAADLGVVSVRLEFRRGGQVGANAFALPDGIVIVTDELVALASHDDELRAVFAHELGHVRYRHAMRVLLSTSASTLLAVTLLGDVTAASSLVASIPATLAHAAYTRDLEREADDVARGWLEQANVPHARMDALLRRLEQQPGARGWNYLSTHPPLDERLRPARRE